MNDLSGMTPEESLHHINRVARAAGCRVKWSPTVPNELLFPDGSAVTLIRHGSSDDPKSKELIVYDAEAGGGGSIDEIIERHRAKSEGAVSLGQTHKLLDGASSDDRNRRAVREAFIELVGYPDQQTDDERLGRAVGLLLGVIRGEARRIARAEIELAVGSAKRAQMED